MVQPSPPTPPWLSPVQIVVSVILFIAILTFSSSAAPVLAAQQPLEIGVPITHQLAKDQIDKYTLTLAADEYARVVVRQLGVDVFLVVQGIQQNFPVDVASGSAGQEVVELIGKSGNYRLQVQTKEPGSGSYQILLEERRPAMQFDRQRVAAQEAFLEGDRLRRTGTRESLEAAVTSLDNSIQLWREVNDLRSTALALRSRGAANFFLNLMYESLASYREALQILESLPNRLDEAATLQSLGITQIAVGDTSGAANSFQRALKFFNDENDQKYIGSTLYQLGRVSYLSGNLVEAEGFYQKALPIRQGLNDRAGQAYTLVGIGQVYANGFADYAQAFEFYNRALATLEPDLHGPAYVQVLGDLGRLYFSQNNHEAALTAYQNAIEIVHDRNVRAEAELQMYVGMVHAAKGEHQTALTRFDKALARQCKAIDTMGVSETLRDLQSQRCDLVGAAHTLKNMGLSYAATNNTSKALERLNQALEIWTHLLYRTAEADTRYAIARVQQDIGELAKAREQIEAALPIIESLRTRIANIHFRTSYFASAQKFYELYIDVLMQQYHETKDPSLQARALTYSERARARSMLDTLIEARADIRQGAKAEDLKQEAELQQKLTLVSQRQMIDPQQSQKQQDNIRKSLAALMVDYHALEARIRENSPRYAALTYPEQLSLEKIRSVLAKDQVLLEYALGYKRSYVWVVTPQEIVSYELPGRYVIEASADNFRSLLLEQSPKYEAAANELSDMLLGKIKLPGDSRLLIVASGRLQYLPFGALPVPTTSQLLESGSAPKSERKPLLVQHEIETLPSVSVLVELKREKLDSERYKARKQLLVIADPVFREDDDRFNRDGKQRRSARRTNYSEPAVAEQRAEHLITRMFRDGRVPRLPFTRREANAILSVVGRGRGEKVLDFDASRNFVTKPGVLSHYRIVHFATHGVMNDEYPELSGLLFSLYDKQGHRQEGLLQMHEIYNLDIPAEIVVLSACDTSIAKEINGEGLPGLSRAFIYAGALNIVASLWEVGDDSTAELMGLFYRNLMEAKTPRPADALRLAQIEMWKKNPKEPHRWAAFITYGRPDEGDSQR